MRSGAAYRYRHPIRFWSYLAVGFVFGAGVLVFAGRVGWWISKQFNPSSGAAELGADCQLTSGL
jgi:hypothetical protein